MSYVNSTSMGCRCEYSICSICHNESHTEEDFCEHIRNYKGTTYNGLPVWEDNRNCDFFEDSFVTVGADPNARVMEKIASKTKRKFIEYHANNLNNIKYNKIEKEVNQRMEKGRISSLFDQLKDLPWT